MKGSSRREQRRQIEALLERERLDPGPSTAVREGVSNRVEATLGSDIGNAQVLARQITRRSRPSLAVVPKVAKPALASLLAYAPIAFASLGAVTIAGGVAYLGLPGETKERLLGAVHLSRRATSSPPAALPIAPPSPPAPEEGDVTPPPVAIPAIVEPAAGLAARRRGSRVVLPSAAPAPDRDLSLAEESALLEAARSDLLRGSATGALQALAIHEHRFPTGRMVEQREALTIQALVVAGRRDEASRRAQQFRERFPGSLMLEVIQSALHTEGASR